MSEYNQTNQCPWRVLSSCKQTSSMDATVWLVLSEQRTAQKAFRYSRLALGSVWLNTTKHHISLWGGDMCQVLLLAPRGSVALHQNGSASSEEIQLVHIKCDRLHWFNPAQFSVCCWIILTVSRPGCVFYSVFYFNNIRGNVKLTSTWITGSKISQQNLAWSIALPSLACLLFLCLRAKTRWHSQRAEPTSGRGFHTIPIFFIQQSSPAWLFIYQTLLFSRKQHI